MIKDKITEALKERFRDAIKKTIDTGNEQGFFICANKEGKLYASKSCEGDECEVILGDHFGVCPQRVQGDFHAYPYVANARKEYKKKGINPPPDDILKEEVRSTLIDKHEEKGLNGLSPVIPSYNDILSIIIDKCFKETDAATCVGSDLDDSAVECWTSKDPRRGQCVRAVFELRRSVQEKKKLSPKKWVVPIFDIENINLRNNLRNNGR